MFVWDAGLLKQLTAGYSSDSVLSFAMTGLVVGALVCSALTHQHLLQLLHGLIGDADAVDFTDLVSNMQRP